MHIYLKHDLHGTKVAISDLEAAADKKNGWYEFDPCQPAFTEIPVDQPHDTGNALVVRRGRKPKVKE